jgi:ribulose kinase
MAKTDDDSAISIVAKDFHIYPDFHGNRSPLADPNLRGSVCGLTLDNSSLDNLAITYLAALQALAYQTKHIVDIMKSHGMSFKLIKIIGGLASNNLYCQLISDVVDLPVLVADNKSSFDSIGLLGASILGASNTNEFRGKSLEFLFNSFGRRANENDDLVFLQSSKSMRKFHEQKFKVYLRMLDDQTAYKNLMNQI